jgi:5-formyltetrahydrofolate cyclo-ligase
VVLPGRRLAFYPVPADPSQLRPGPFRIPEPPKEGVPPVPLEAIDVLLLPGVAFDPAGHRLGYGAGYYDRYLAPLKTEEAGDALRLPASPETTKRRPLLVGLAFSVQVLPALPAEPHDVRVDVLATETGLQRIP